MPAKAQERLNVPLFVFVRYYVTFLNVSETTEFLLETAFCEHWELFRFFGNMRLIKYIFLKKLLISKKLKSFFAINITFFEIVY